MAQDYEQPDHDTAASQDTARPAVGRGWRWAIGIAALLLAAALGGWLMRKDIADNLIARQLEQLGLPARYEVVAIGPARQVVRNLVIGDPARPDLTIRELRIATRLRWGLPGIGRITIVRPRLYGTMRQGRLSFGSLDKALFSGTGGPAELPDLDIAVIDGRALLDGGQGRIGIKLRGAGQLRDGFAGELAAVSPELALGDCRAGRTTLYGRITTAAARPRFEGPLRLRRLACPQYPLAVQRAGAQLAITLDSTLDGGAGRIGLRTGGAAATGLRAGGLSGTLDIAYRKNALNARYRLAARGVETGQARFAELSFEGRGRSVDGLARFDLEGDLAGRGMALGGGLDQALRTAERSGQGTLAAPLLAQVRRGLGREARGGAMLANMILRQTDQGISLVIPQGTIRGGSGAALLAVSRVQALLGADGVSRVTGNFATGGQGLPRLSGRMETDHAGRLAMRIAMPAYGPPGNQLALPRFSVTQDRHGALAFAGEVRLSGDVPGGRAENLLLPVEGRWAASGLFTLWPGCTRVGFDRLRLGGLELNRHSARVCPPPGGAILRGGQGWRIAARLPALELTGLLGDAPVHITSGPIAVARQGAGDTVVRAQSVLVLLGPAAARSRFAVSDLEARVGQETAGTLGDGAVSLFAVPLDLRHISGNWRYADGALALGDARFTLVDRDPANRFKPLVARDAALRLADGAITAHAVMREPESDRAVARVDIAHDLARASGHADLAVEDLLFDDRLQASAISDLALGVVANLEGVVNATGRIDWNGDSVTSHGRAVADGLAFAAPFGPVKGLSGEVVFTDLLGLATAPDQKLRIASINPGIEVVDGTLSFQIKPGHVLEVHGAHWPFMGGTLTLDPARMQLGIAETRYYTLRVAGLDAATFVRHLEMGNLNASGTFDGELPLIFDENGGRIEGGQLISRPPGGNVAYVGELTYKDLSAMGNFAFDMLKSVDFQRMEISMGGALAGEIITRVSFNGISQGAGARRNFLTRQISRLPIRFILNIKAPFFSLFAPLRSLYDPSYVADPRTLGLTGTDWPKDITTPPGTTALAIQPPVSESTP